MSKVKFIILFIIAAFITFNTDAAAKDRHRFHSSLTRVDHDANEKNIKITIQLITHDVSEVFEKISGKTVELENSPGLLEKYLAENFVMRDKTGKNLDLKWVGTETDFDRTFVYLEIPSEESIEGFSLSNTIFFETYKKQTNIVIAKFGDEKADLLFKATDGFKKIEKNHKSES